MSSRRQPRWAAGTVADSTADVAEHDGPWCTMREDGTFGRPIAIDEIQRWRPSLEVLGRRRLATQKKRAEQRDFGRFQQGCYAGCEEGPGHPQVSHRAGQVVLPIPLGQYAHARADGQEKKNLTSARIRRIRRKLEVARAGARRIAQRSGEAPDAAGESPMWDEDTLGRAGRARCERNKSGMVRHGLVPYFRIFADAQEGARRRLRREVFQCFSFYHRGAPPAVRPPLVCRPTARLKC
ncbi:hypothetical protein F4782DRAFT_470249 [Xylaria castorea]|nr:hypothetical protein F4782DRAFT_470249 [Xylaria castorea]